MLDAGYWILDTGCWHLESSIQYLVFAQTPKIHTHQLTHPGFLHRYTINNIHGTHRHFIVRYDDELRIVAELADHIGKLAYVGIIERRIHLVEYTEWGRLNQVNREQQCCRGQCSFTTA